MSEPSPAVRHYTDLYATLAPSLAGGQRLEPLRERGLAAFTASGFPTLRDEEWKYTSLRMLERGRFEATAGTPAPERDEIDALAIAGLEGPRVVFVNGRYAPDLSSDDAIPGLHIDTLIGTDAAPAARLGAVAPLEQHRFAALNTALMQDAALIGIDADADLTASVYLLFVSAPGEAPALTQPRVLVNAARGSRASLIEHHVGLPDAANFSNAVTELVLEEGANVEHYRVQQESESGFHIAGIHAELGRDARFVSHNLCLGGRLARTDINVRLAAPGAETVLNGLFLASGRQHLDNHTRVDHLAPHTRSDEEYRGVLDGHGRGVFNGKVLVHEGAQKIDAAQSSMNLLLSDNAEIDTKPELEIYADDVKCSHGATVGQLDRDAVFYLRSRGLSEELARNLLTYAFAEDLVTRLPEPAVRAHVERAVLDSLPGSEKITEFL